MTTDQKLELLKSIRFRIKGHIGELEKALGASMAFQVTRYLAECDREIKDLAVQVRRLEI